MRFCLHIAFVVLALLTGTFYAQTPGDSSLVKKDSLYAPREIFSARPSNAFQNQFKPGVLYIIKSNLGITYIGFVVKEEEYFIVIENRKTQERTELRRGEIRSAREFSDKQSFESILGDNPHAANYMFASSAFLFTPQELSSNSHLFIFNSIDYAINENFDVSATSLVFYPFLLSAKCAVKLDENNYIGGSVFGLANVLSTDYTGGFLAGYGGTAKYTSGTSNRNFTIAGGVLALKAEMFGAPTSMNFYNLFFGNVAYCSRISERLALNLEGWYFPQAQIGFAGAGLKLVGDESTSWTFGCYSIVNFQSPTVNLNFKALPIPYVGITQKF